MSLMQQDLLFLALIEIQWVEWSSKFVHNWNLHLKDANFNCTIWCNFRKVREVTFIYLWLLKVTNKSGGKKVKLNEKSTSHVIKSLFTKYIEQCNASAWSYKRPKLLSNENKIVFPS